MMLAAPCARLFSSTVTAAKHAASIGEAPKKMAASWRPL